MLVQTNDPHYARGDVQSGNTNRIARQHIQKFWSVPITEGRAVIQGHPIDADEEADPLDAMDNIDHHEPEAMGGRMAAQTGEFLVAVDEDDGSACATCQSLWCRGLTIGMCPERDTVGEMFLVK